MRVDQEDAKLRVKLNSVWLSAGLPNDKRKSVGSVHKSVVRFAKTFCCDEELSLLMSWPSFAAGKPSFPTCSLNSNLREKIRTRCDLLESDGSLMSVLSSGVCSV